MGYVVRTKVIPGGKGPRSETCVVQVHEGAGCEYDFLHTPGGVEFVRDGHTVFASREEAEEEDRRRGEAAGAKAP